jgi:hypothetical protein
MDTYCIERFIAGGYSSRSFKIKYISYASDTQK